MVLHFIRNPVFRCNLKKGFRNSNLVTLEFHHFVSKQPRILNLMMQQRSHYWVSGIFGKQSELTLKHMDKVPIAYKMIYRNDDVDVHLKWFHLAVFIVTGVIIGMIVLKIDVETPKYIADKKSDPVRNELLMIFFAYSLCFMVFHGCMKRMPVRIYKVPKQEKHIFVFNAAIPFTTKKLPCTKGEFVKVDNDKYLPFISGESIYRITGKRNIFLFENGFKVPANLEILLGQRKDFDDD